MRAQPELRGGAARKPPPQPRVARLRRVTANPGLKFICQLLRAQHSSVGEHAAEKKGINPKADPSKLRPASELSAFLICRWYDKTNTFASTIKHAQKQGYNLYNAAIERAIKSERERKV